jgi:Flp pilus assembly protein TadB
VKPWLEGDNMIDTVHEIAPLLGASSLAWLAYYLTRRVRIRRGIERHLQDFYASSTHPSDSRTDQFGTRLTGHLPFSLAPWEGHLKWAQHGGYFKDWSTGRLVFRALLYACLGMGMLLVNPSAAALLVPLAAMLYPFISVRAKANTVRKRVVRNLPELATLVAAEMSAGTSPEQAIQRAALLPGPANLLLREFLREARREGRPLFGHTPIRGALVEACSQADLPELTAFASQLDLVAEKGMAGATLMNEVARTLSREYRAKLDREVEKLNGRLMLATAVFFFIPFVLVILGSFIAPVMAIFR